MVGGCATQWVRGRPIDMCMRIKVQAETPEVDCLMCYRWVLQAVPLVVCLLTPLVQWSNCHRAPEYNAAAPVSLVVD